MDRSATSPRRSDRIWVIAIGLAVALGAAVRVWAALQWRMNFDSDEALFALMAKHMMHGFFSPVEYGTQHHGTLESLLSAGLMSLFGQSVPVFRLSAVALMTVFLALAAYFFRTHWGSRVGFLATLFLAVPGFHILEWNYQPIGGYSVMMASGMGVLILADRISSESKNRAATILAFGVLAGLGLWSNQLMVVFLGAALVPLLMGSQEWQAAREWASSKFAVRGIPATFAFGLLTPAFVCFVVGGFFISGCNPVWRFTRLELIFKILFIMSLLAVGAALFAQSTDKRKRVLDLSVLGVGAAIGFAPMWIGWITGQLGVVNVLHRSCPTGILDRSQLLTERILPALWGVPAFEAFGSLSWWQTLLWGMVGVLILLALIYFAVSRRRTLVRAWLWSSDVPESRGDLVISLLFLISLALSVFGNNTVDVYSVRHLLAAGVASAVIFALAIDAAIRFKKVPGVLSGVFWFLMVAIPALHMADGHWRVKFTTYDPASIDQLVASLQGHGVDSGYADYWGAYTLDYLSGERIAMAPYNTGDRYPAFSRQVSSREKVAFIFPATHSPDRGADSLTLANWLRLPNDFSGEGPAKDSIIQMTEASKVEATYTVGPWAVWIVGK